MYICNYSKPPTDQFNYYETTTTIFPNPPTHPHNPRPSHPHPINEKEIPTSVCHPYLTAFCTTIVIIIRV